MNIRCNEIKEIIKQQLKHYFDIDIIEDLSVGNALSYVFHVEKNGNFVIKTYVEECYDTIHEKRQIYENEVKMMNILSKEDFISEIIYNKSFVVMDKYNIYMIVMPYYICIGKILKDGYILKSKEKIKLMCDIANALLKGHQHSIIHRDVKLFNIFFDGINYILGDFGSATDMINSCSEKFGSIMYLPPELINHNGMYNKTTDIYSFGLAVYEMYNGILPFMYDESTEENVKDAIAKRIKTEKFPQLLIPKSVYMIICKCCKINIYERYQSSEQLLEDILRL